MKKYIKILSVILFVLILTGCKSDKKIDTVLYDELKDQKIIEDLTYVTKVTCYDAINNEPPTEDYIYKDRWGNILGIRYVEYVGENDYDYIIRLYSNGIELDDPFYVSNITNKYCTYDDKSLSLRPKYEFGNITYYSVKKKDKFFGILGSYYEINKVES